MLALYSIVAIGYSATQRICDIRHRAPFMNAAVAPIAVPQHEAYLSDVCMTVPPAALSSLAGLLVSRGASLVEPGQDESLHPLLVPLARQDTGERTGEVTGLLRWPAASGGGSKLPLVRTDGRQLVLLADCPEHFVARAAAVADFEGASDAATLAALAAEAGVPYAAGTAATTTGGLPGYLLTKVGPFIAEYEDLAKKHRASGSDEAALITCERSQNLFKAWGRPLAFHARMMNELGRQEEARDLARQALSMPLWTLGDNFAEICGIAQSTVDEQLDALRTKADGRLTPEQLRAQKGTEQRTPQEIARDRASYLLDLAVAAPDEYSWQSMRKDLGSLYMEAGMGSIAKFVAM